MTEMMQIPNDSKKSVVSFTDCCFTSCCACLTLKSCVNSLFPVLHVKPSLNKALDNVKYTTEEKRVEEK
jgi:hypothetical protein